MIGFRAIRAIQRGTRRAFTLVEMLIVAALIALFAGLAVFNVTEQYELNKQKAAVAECRQIGTSMNFALQDLGFFPKGKGAAAAAEGQTALGGSIPVNPSGGLKAKGHPVGTTGVAQAVEVFEQFRGRAGARLVKDAQVGLTHNIGATGGSCAVHLWGVA